MDKGGGGPGAICLFFFSLFCCFLLLFSSFVAWEEGEEGLLRIDLEVSWHHRHHPTKEDDLLERGMNDSHRV